jgi:predicted nucleotidyltransferase
MSTRPETQTKMGTVQRKKATHAEAKQVILDLKQQLPAILLKQPVYLAYAYGSMAAGCPTPLSDVDIALVLEPHCELDAYQQFMLELDIAAEIEQHCGIQDADVRSIDKAPLRIQGQVLSQGVLLYSRDEAFRVDYETRTRKRYFDFQPVLAMMRQAYFDHLEADLTEKGLYG